jgi:VIT1/CCC1 family predicted Fe2+/Mn2+ transporter
MMRFELGLEEPDPKRALTSAGTIAASYVAGGLIPLSPYIVLTNSYRGLIVSAIVTLIALAVFGYIKGKYTGARAFRSAMQTMLIGGVAAGVAFALAKWIA